MIYIDAKKCDRCGKCYKVCEKHVFEKINGLVIYKTIKCNSCGACKKVCDKNAIEVFKN